MAFFGHFLPVNSIIDSSVQFQKGTELAGGSRVGVITRWQFLLDQLSTGCQVRIIMFIFKQFIQDWKKRGGAIVHKIIHGLGDTIFVHLVNVDSVNK